MDYVPCSSQDYVKSIHSDMQDLSWSEYFRQVYGSNFSDDALPYSSNGSHDSVKLTSNVQFYYLNSNVRVISLSAVQSMRYSTSRFMTKINQVAEPLRSHSWVEVMRHNISHVLPSFPCEGFTAPNFTSAIKPIPYINSTKVPYGCWFFYAPGSGIYINIGNIWVIKKKYKAMSRLFDGYINSKGCVDGDNANSCYDKYFCSAALAKGFTMLMALSIIIVIIIII